MKKLSIALLLLSSVVMINGAYADVERFDPPGAAQPGTLEHFARKPARSSEGAWDIRRFDPRAAVSHRSARLHGQGVAQRTVQLKLYNVTGVQGRTIEAQMRGASQRTYGIKNTDSFRAVVNKLAALYGVSAYRVQLLASDGTLITDNSIWANPFGVGSKQAFAKGHKMAKTSQSIPPVKIAVRILTKKQ